MINKFQFVAPLRTASAVLYFYNAKIHSFLSDGLVDIKSPGRFNPPGLSFKRCTIYGNDKTCRWPVSEKDNPAQR